MGMNTDAVQRLYVAYFNRPADPVSMSVYESLLPTDRAATQAELQALAEQYSVLRLNTPACTPVCRIPKLLISSIRIFLVGRRKSTVWYTGC